jgi:hypothetical protein
LEIKAGEGCQQQRSQTTADDKLALAPAHGLGFGRFREGNGRFQLGQRRR